MSLKKSLKIVDHMLQCFVPCSCVTLSQLNICLKKDRNNNKNKARS